jgi:hybrid cluster-associated redox disulfide protein
VLITEKMSILEVVEKYPQTITVFRNHGMGCFGCSAAQFENIEQGAMAHGISITELITELNKAINSSDSGNF